MNYSQLLAYRNIIMGFFFKLFPIKQNRFYFNSFHGLYTDSPKRISEELHKYYPKAVYYWELTSKSQGPLPQYIKPVIPNTIRSIYLKFTSRLIVDNYLGAFSGFQVPGSLKYKILTSSFKTGQLIIGTWHGTSLKKIATDEPCNEGKNLMFFTNTNYLICESMHMKNILHRITFGKIPILMTGYPRNDILFLDNTNIKKQLRKKLKLPENKKIILYAPTFRADNIMMSGLFQVTQMNMTKLFEKCREQFGGEWIFVFRVHDSVILSMKGHDVCNEKVLSGNIGDDMAEYLAIADILITDYSSSMFDFCLTKRPCFLYCPDLEHYMNVERGFYLNKSDLPFSVAVTSEELYENIDIFSYKEYASKLKAFQKMIGSVDDGHATEKVVEIIVKELGTENVHG